ncbi:MAG: Do family serine endopeptidase [Methyloversatilis sp.]|uniref:Peptidase S1 n=1 Tax=Methyloversatilis universalis (strain ATCC BAA-1314 / DSM 25237 / JCM 13912 / CCUG 52030 / FAM5) TaxID=1000565 RepID=F5RDS6_METUF|nr:Do family serine endopeptidase [Methyloversatilis universalis]EGK71057.1 Putative peptidase S1 [Methyloversatilis universalis FAM5]MCP4638586.1 Do family serine endopeptidase [Methyloversatilis sp.]
MQRLWLVFAQSVTAALAVLFVVVTLKPDWLPARSSPAQNGASPLPSIEHLLPAQPPVATRVEAAKVVSYSDAAQKALPSVVHVFTTKAVRTPQHPLMNDPVFRHFFGDRLGSQPQRQMGLGSGVIVSEDGVVLTNNHVVEAADEIEVSLNDGGKYPAVLIGSDPESDLAVLRVKAPGKLPAVSFASSDSLQIGDVVLAIGNPFDVGQTVTMGIVSALGRSQLGINTFENFIQTDAAINPGNSGGALVDANGNLVGINTAIYSRSGGSLGIGFAIPASTARSVMEQIVASGSVTRGWVGVEVQELTPELAESFKYPLTGGALIAGVMRGSPADRGGVRPGDVLLEVEGRKVKDASGMLQLIAALVPGQQATLKVYRSGGERDIAVTVGKRPINGVAAKNRE